MILVSYYTDLVSKTLAQLLHESAKRFAIPVDIEGLSGAVQRAEFIRRMLTKWEGHAVLYIEPGGLLRQQPEAFGGTPAFEMAAYVYSSTTPNIKSNKKKFNGIGEIQPFTLYFANTHNAHVVLDRWIESNRAHMDRPEMQNLLYFLAYEEIAFEYIPQSYCWIERLMRPFDQDTKPIIEHIAPKLPNAPATLPLEQSPIAIWRSLVGLGDTFYMRPAVKRLAERDGVVHVVSPWPQLFWDIPKARVLKPDAVVYRAQAANIAAMPQDVWAGTYTGDPSRLLEFNNEDFQKYNHTVTEAFLARAGFAGQVTPEEFGFKPPVEWVEGWMREIPRPFAIVHPPTIRTEWANPARNPRHGYLQELMAAAPWVHWISIAWLKQHSEAIDGPPLDGVFKAFDNGELSTEALMGLVSVADFVVTPPCFLLPMAAALGVPTFSVFGGSVPPHFLIDKACSNHVKYAAPDPFCACYLTHHECRKAIPGLVAAFEQFLAGLHL